MRFALLILVAAAAIGGLLAWLNWRDLDEDTWPYQYVGI